MTLAPYYVLWSFCAGALALVTVGALWLVAREATGAVLRRLWISDGIALWLGFAAGYHGVFFVLGPYGEALGDKGGIWLICAFGVSYPALRLLPNPLRNPTALLAFALVAWAWSIGAGYHFVEEMARSAALLRDRPQQVLEIPAADLRPLRKALFLNELDEGQRHRTADLLAALAPGAPPDQARVSSAKQTLIPELLEHFRRDLSRLRTYQALQVLLLAAVLLAWGFGRMPGP
jgi:hypothetical protein